MRASSVVSVILRITELISAAVVTGIVGEYTHYVDVANDNPGSRIVYTIAIGGIGIFFSLILMPPFSYSFYAFLVDFALFLLWIVAFGLLENLGSCDSEWYLTHWGYYWGGWWRTPQVRLTPVLVGTSACGKWRATLAFSFIGGFCWLASGILGLYVCIKKYEKRQTEKNVAAVEGMRVRNAIHPGENGIAEKSDGAGGSAEV